MQFIMIRGGNMDNFISKGNPEVSGLYKIDRDKQGISYRYYDAKKKKWSRPDYDPYTANELKDTDPLVGFFPWCGPLRLRPKEEVMSEPEVKRPGRPKKVLVAPSESVEDVPKPTKAPKPKKGVKMKMSTGTNPSMADGTIFFRQDRNKWVVLWNGKQEAARDTVEACQKFLKKKYNVEGAVIPTNT
jgi:hypothetical protein